MTSKPATGPATDVEAAHSRQREPWDYGGNPLARTDTTGSRVGPSLGQFAPGLFRPVDDAKVANGAPMGLAGFALTTFVLALINLNVRGVQTPNLVVGPALAYGGLVQLLGGMWEMASNNVFAATALSSYGGFWIGLGIIFTPGGFGIADAYGGMTPAFFTAVGFYLMGWFVFTVLMTLATVRSNLIFFLLFLTVAMAFLLLSLSFLDNTGTTPAMQNAILAHAGGGFAMIAAFLAWWTMYAGVANRENSFFLVPTFPFPWSPEGRSSRGRRAPP